MVGRLAGWWFLKSLLKLFGIFPELSAPVAQLRTTNMRIHTFDGNNARMITVIPPSHVPIWYSHQVVLEHVAADMLTNTHHSYSGCRLLFEGVNRVYDTLLSGAESK